MEDKLTNMECMPQSKKGCRYYYPTEEGEGAKARERLEKIIEWKRMHSE